jgi:hypothetical protein
MSEIEQIQMIIKDGDCINFTIYTCDDCKLVDKICIGKRCINNVIENAKFRLLKYKLGIL